MSENKQALQVAALKNGTVIDLSLIHICCVLLPCSESHKRYRSAATSNREKEWSPHCSNPVL